MMLQIDNIRLIGCWDCCEAHDAGRGLDGTRSPRRGRTQENVTRLLSDEPTTLQWDIGMEGWGDGILSRHKKTRGEKDTTIHHKRRYDFTSVPPQPHNHPLANCRRTIFVRHVVDERPLSSLGYFSLFISICKHRHERTRGPREGGFCWDGGSSMLRSRLASSSPPHSAGTGRSEDHSSPCTRGKPAPGKQLATSTTRSPGQLAQPRHPGQAPSPMRLPRRREPGPRLTVERPEANTHIEAARAPDDRHKLRPQRCSRRTTQSLLLLALGIFPPSPSPPSSSLLPLPFQPPPPPCAPPRRSPSGCWPPWCMAAPL